MPIDPTILGFGNKWYAPAKDNADVIELPTGKKIQMVTAPYFLITKLEAFSNRGGGDYLASHDIEDIIAVLDGRSNIVIEVKQSDTALIKCLFNRFKALLDDNRFVDAISGHMPTDSASQRRVPLILETLKKIIED